ncbi:FAD-dependent oxidoreductase [Thioclava sp. FTW29]|uniref:FAD-dependent oxidoreductase n=1 Tax=Thioclava litoralis TaxID=3076557 RepID=A0ABZ1E499_9RHOB|nr:FAD-dependent oxidoreductase [Thioclava sp. FTW29]
MTDFIVLGAGMVGVGSALALQARGHEVCLIDRQAPGLETSHGNAGVIQSEAVEPYAIPRDLATLWSYASGQSNDVVWHLGHVLPMLPNLWRYFRASAPAAHKRAAASYVELIRRALFDHAPLISASGAEPLIRRSGMGELYRSPKALEAAQAHATRIEAEYGIPFETHSRAELQAAEPALTGEVAGMVLWTSPWSSMDPGALTRAYADLFVERGGQIVTGEAMTLTREPAQGWSVMTSDGKIHAEQAVVSLGPWSPALLARFGRRVPMILKRGYHGHYRTAQTLSRPYVDVDSGIVLSSMTRGLRITTGAELTAASAPRCLRQLERGRQAAGELMEIGEAVPDSLWHGHRPCLAGMLPMVGPVAGEAGLWLNTGHGHQGFTLGPTTGEILAQIVEGRQDALTQALAPQFL